jgi:hypothetical protein
MAGTDRSYVSLDGLNERSLAKTDPQLFIELHKMQKSFPTPQTP